MLITFRITSQIKDRIDHLVAIGLYPDTNAVCVVALENLLVAEEEHASASLRVATKSTPVSPAVAKPAYSGDASTPQLALTANPTISCFSWEGTPPGVEKLVKGFPPDRYSRGDKVSLERWLFGQQNRVLPLKVNARLLLALLADKDEQPLMSAIAEEMSMYAVAVAEKLAQIDDEKGHKKDDALCTAFPATQSDKSRARYADQFIAYENGHGELSGMLIDWKLAAVERKKGKSFLFPTQACLAFANLPSPLLDTESQTGAIIRFSDEELSWALNHVAQNVHVESFAFVTVLRAISGGANDPTSLDRYLHENGVVEHEKTSDDFVATQRAGAVSRMADLDLIRRVRNGVRITYDITLRGHTWLNAFN